MCYAYAQMISAALGLEHIDIKPEPVYKLPDGFPEGVQGIPIINDQNNRVATGWTFNGRTVVILRACSEARGDHIVIFKKR